MYKGYASDVSKASGSSSKEKEIGLEDLLFFGCEENDSNAVSDILESGGVSPTCYNYEGFTPLLAAVCNGHMDCIEVLLEYSVDVDQQDMNTGCTPLHVASQWGYTDITKLLIEHKASIEAGLWDTEETPLYVAALEGNVECFRALMDAGANTKIEISSGENPLYIAAQMDHIEIVKLILSETDMHVEHGTGGYTPLMIAAVHGRKLMVRNMRYGARVQLLHESGAKIDATDKDGCTSLHLASNEGHVDVVQLLVERKCAVDQKQSDGATPLFLASQEGHHQVAQTLINQKAQIDSRREDNLSPLAIAISYGHIKSARVLLEGKADVNMRCPVQGKLSFPIEIAESQEDSEMMLLLAQHSPKPQPPRPQAIQRSVSAEVTLSQLAKPPSQRVPLRRVHSLMTLPPPDSRAGGLLPPLQTILATDTRPHDSVGLSTPRSSSSGGSPGAAAYVPGHVRAHSPTIPATPHLLESPPALDGSFPVTIPFLPDPLEPPPPSSGLSANDRFSPHPDRQTALQSPNTVNAKRANKLSLNSANKSAFDFSRRRSHSLITTVPGTPPNVSRGGDNYRPRSCPSRIPLRTMLPRGPQSLATKRPPPLKPDVSPLATGDRPSPLHDANSPFTPAARPPPSQTSPFTPRGRPPPLQISPWARPSPPSENSPLSPVGLPPSQNGPFSRGSARTSFSGTNTPVDLDRLIPSELPPPVRSHNLEWSCDAMALPAGKHQELPLSISNRAILRYRFDTKGGDIGFFITFDQFNGDSVVLVESMRHQCHLSPTQGEVVVDGAGTARLVWDNSYSWLSTKTLSYIVQLENISDDKDYIIDRTSSLAKLGANSNDVTTLTEDEFDERKEDIPSPLTSPIIKVHKKTGFTSSDDDREDVLEEPKQWDRRCTIS